jgi:hypothetical protein
MNAIENKVDASGEAESRNIAKSMSALRAETNTASRRNPPQLRRGSGEGHRCATFLSVQRGIGGAEVGKKVDAA